MRRLLSASLLLVLLLPVLLPQALQAQAQTESRKYFPEKGHWVTNDFWQRYQDTPNAELVFGFPITDAYADGTTGQLIQYFERARFELHPDAPPELSVQLSPLGTYLYTPGQAADIVSNATTCRSFPETGFRVCYAFLEFFNKNGGVAVFGYPISNYETHAGRYVQYFQRARFEFHPELPVGEQVQLSNLGMEYFEQRKENPLRLEANRSEEDNLVQTILRLQVRAYPERAVSAFQDQQTIYVIVQDQNLQPVSGASVDIKVMLPDGTEQRYIGQNPTDKNGVATINFHYQSRLPGAARVQVNVLAQDKRQQTVTSFRIWW